MDVKQLSWPAKSPGGEAIPLFCRAERPSQHTDKKNIADKKKLK
jgi:hypothetical protein